MNSWLDAIAAGVLEGQQKAAARNKGIVESLLPVLAQIQPSRQTTSPGVLHASRTGLSGYEPPVQTQEDNPVFTRGMEVLQRANTGGGLGRFLGTGAGVKGLDEFVRVLAEANQEQRRAKRSESLEDLRGEYALGKEFGLDKFTPNEPRRTRYGDLSDEARFAQENPEGYATIRPRRDQQGPRPTRRQVGYTDALRMVMGERGYVPDPSSQTGFVDPRTGQDVDPQAVQEAQQRAAEMVRSGIEQAPLQPIQRPAGGGAAAAGAGGEDAGALQADLKAQLQQDIDDYTARFGQPPSDDDFREMLQRRSGGVQRGF